MLSGAALVTATSHGANALLQDEVLLALAASSTPIASHCAVDICLRLCRRWRAARATSRSCATWQRKTTSSPRRTPASQPGALLLTCTAACCHFAQLPLVITPRLGALSLDTCGKCYVHSPAPCRKVTILERRASIRANCPCWCLAHQLDQCLGLLDDLGISRCLLLCCAAPRRCCSRTASS